MASVYEAEVFPKHEDTMLRGLPGALALLAGIALVTGVLDEGVRAALWPALVGCLAVTIVGGALHFRIRRQHTQRMIVTRERDELVAVVGRARLRAPTITCGLTREFTGRRSYPVAWVALQTNDGVVVVRKGLGIVDATPEWPEAPIPVGVWYTGDPVGLHLAIVLRSAVSAGSP